MKINKFFTGLTVMFSLSSVLWGGGQAEQTNSYSGSEGHITIYVSGPAEMLNILEKSFEEERGDVIDMVHMGCGPLRQRVWTEMEAGMINADVFWGSDPLLFMALDDRGKLEEYRPEGYENLKDEFHTVPGFTYTNERYGVVIYNKDVLSRKPASFTDLTSKELEGSICHADPAFSSTALALVSGLWDLENGEGDFHRNLRKNGLFLTKKNSDVPSKIQEGEFIAGIAPHDAVLRLQKKAAKDGYPTPLAISWPSEGAVAIQRPVAISKNEDRPEINEKLAEAFVDFMISKKAQNITMKFGFISVRKDISLPAGLPEDILKIIPDWEQLSQNQNVINEEFKKIFY